MIEERSIAVATCDACGHQDYADEQGMFLGGEGYSVTFVQHKDGTRHNAYACRLPHMNKAARHVLLRWERERNSDSWYDNGGDMPAPWSTVDAPPLPAAPDQVEEAQ